MRKDPIKIVCLIIAIIVVVISTKDSFLEFFNGSDQDFKAIQEELNSEINTVMTEEDQ